MRHKPSYRETFRSATQAEGKSARQSGGSQYGHVWIEFTPNEEGGWFLHPENATFGGVVPREYIPAVEAGLKDAMENGVLALMVSKLSFTMVLTTMSTLLKLPLR